MNRPEHRLLLACARICSEQERGDRILACLAEKIDWEYLLRAAGRHMMTNGGGAILLMSSSNVIVGVGAVAEGRFFLA